MRIKSYVLRIAATLVLAAGTAMPGAAQQSEKDIANEARGTARDATLDSSILGVESTPAGGPQYGGSDTTVRQSGTATAFCWPPPAGGNPTTDHYQDIGFGYSLSCVIDGTSLTELWKAPDSVGGNEGILTTSVGDTASTTLGSGTITVKISNCESPRSQGQRRCTVALTAARRQAGSNSVLSAQGASSAASNPTYSSVVAMGITDDAGNTVQAGTNPNSSEFTAAMQPTGVAGYAADCGSRAVTDASATGTVTACDGSTAYTASPNMDGWENQPDTPTDPNGLSQVIGAAAMLDALKKDISDSNPPTFFLGHKESCHQIIGCGEWPKCCCDTDLKSSDENSWGGCSKSEVRLAGYRRQHLATKISDCCNHSLPLIGCIEKQRDWCRFESVLARLVQEQGREQLAALAAAGPSPLPAPSVMIAFSYYGAAASAPPPPAPTLTVSASPTEVEMGQSTTVSWSSANASRCSYVDPDSGASASVNTSGSFSASPEVTAVWSFTCEGPGGSMTKSVTVTVKKPPPTPPTIFFQANPVSINYGESTTLTWETNLADTCTASGGWSGSQALAGSTTVSPRSSTDYILSCVGTGGTSTQTVHVNVVPPPPPAITLTANPATVLAVNGSTSTLSWSTTSATACTASGGWSGSRAVNGTESVTISQTTTYTLTCTGVGGTAQQSVTITYERPPKPTVSFDANPTEIDYGASSTLTWATTDASSCSASGGWSGSQAVNGGMATVSPTSATTYVLTCTGLGGTSSASVIVTVRPPPAPSLSFGANPMNIAAGASSTLSWTATNVSSCTASGAWSGGKSLSGSQSVTPPSGTATTYTLSCTGPGGSVTQSVTITVAEDDPPPQPSGPPTITFWADPATINAGQSSTLHWGIAGEVTNCTLTLHNGTSLSFSGALASGQKVVNPPSTYSYQLSCTGPGGTTTQNATVTVNPPPPPPTLDLNLDPTQITTCATADQCHDDPSPHSATLTWSTTNAGACEASGAWSGSQAVNAGSLTISAGQDSHRSAGTYTYTLTCTGPGGSVTKSVTLSVVNPYIPPPTVTISVNPSTSTTTSGGPGGAGSNGGLTNVTVAWSSTGAESCTASSSQTAATTAGWTPWSGAKATSGSESAKARKADNVDCTVMTIFSLSCTGQGGTTTASASHRSTYQGVCR